MGSRRMHCQELLLKELDSLKNKVPKGYNMFEYWKRGYSTSPHLGVMYKICTGLNARHIGEIGVGRSSFVFAEHCRKHGGVFITCDRYDYRWMFDRAGLVPIYVLGDADKFYKHPEAGGLDFLFLDYFSTRKMDAMACYREIKKGLKLMRQNAILAIHDTIENRYNAKNAVERLKIRHKNKYEVLTLPYGFGLTLIRTLCKSKYGKTHGESYKKKDVL